MRSIDDIIQSSIDQMVAQQSPFFEGMVRPHLEEISRQLQIDLDASGYQIVPKQKPHVRSRRHHGK